jgi:hypothetical protein
LTVTDGVALSSQSGFKTKIERIRNPPFTTLIEVLGEGQWRVHRNVAHSVDAILKAQSARGQRPRLGTEIRSYNSSGQMTITFEE